MRAEPMPRALPEVRAAQDGDLKWMKPLWLAMMADHSHQDEAFALAEDAPNIWQRAIWEMMARQDSFVLVAAPLGFCCGWVTRHPAIYLEREVGLLSEICVAPEARGVGVGRALMDAAKDWFFRRDLDTFQLATATFNRDAQAFFEALGGRAILKRYAFSLP